MAVWPAPRVIAVTFDPELVRVGCARCCNPMGSRIPTLCRRRSQFLWTLSAMVRVKNGKSFVSLWYVVDRIQFRLLLLTMYFRVNTACSPIWIELGANNWDFTRFAIAGSNHTADFRLFVSSRDRQVWSSLSEIWEVTSLCMFGTEHLLLFRRQNPGLGRVISADYSLWLTFPRRVFMFYNEKHTLNPEQAWSDKDHNSDLIYWPTKPGPKMLLLTRLQRVWQQ